MNAGSITAMKQTQVASQVGISILKKNMDAQMQAAEKLLNSLDQVSQALVADAQEPGKGRLFDVKA